MKKLHYANFNTVEPEALLPLLNKTRLREHLIDHQLFNEETAKEWIKAKMEMDSLEGCRVRIIYIDDQLAGWGGIQLAEGNYEIAIVLDDAYWGHGKAIFLDFLQWAKEFGHKEVLIHLLDTRKESKYLRKISKSVYQSTMMGNLFTSYVIQV